MTALGAYLERAGHMRRLAGVHDCCTFPADWAMLCGHADPMAAWRGVYDTDAAAERLIADAGGLAELFSEGMASAGIDELLPWQCPDELGDIAVVTLLGHEAGAIYTGKRWAFVPDRGLGLVSLDRDCIVRAWRPQHRG